MFTPAVRRVLKVPEDLSPSRSSASSHFQFNHEVIKGNIPYHFYFITEICLYCELFKNKTHTETNKQGITVISEIVI